MRPEERTEPSDTSAHIACEAAAISCASGIGSSLGYPSGMYARCLASVPTSATRMFDIEIDRTSERPGTSVGLVRIPVSALYLHDQRQPARVRA
jgi:hypothetical protein